MSSRFVKRAADTSAQCYQAEARIENNYNVQWAGCEYSGGSWILWVEW
jgi:hypothetical protein